jgi:hypothetical protein
MSQWQYHVEKYNFRELVKPGNLNSLGKEGWELVCLKRLTGTDKATQIQWLAVFKKQVAEKKG